MTAPDRAEVEAAVERLDSALRSVIGLRAPVLELGAQSVDALRIVLDELGRLEQERAFTLGHGGAWCTACRRAMREGTSVVKTPAVVCMPCAADLATADGRLDPSRLATRDEAGPRDG